MNKITCLQHPTFLIRLKNTLFIIFLSIMLFSCKEKVNTISVKNFENNIWSEVKTPIIKIPINKVDRYFLVDTGANLSVLDKHYYLLNKDKLDQVNEIEINYSGINGTKAEKVYIVNAYFEDKVITFTTSDISEIIKTIKKKCGIEISGIIGSDFMRNYNVVIDYKLKTVTM